MHHQLQMVVQPDPPIRRQLKDKNLDVIGVTEDLIRISVGAGFRLLERGGYGV
ncbi:hypothetical protein [Cupriavidus sp. SW-Y-13]|uniref:hypothetical protein n=1 Tax=Cupriavidus sp. SW-Y-13 TaxID=2653854 RepID=UPI0013663E46|nr:hypothetical protein [Cupriavidus sp. SW-Y-13]